MTESKFKDISDLRQKISELNMALNLLIDFDSVLSIGSKKNGGFEIISENTTTINQKAKLFIADLVKKELEELNAKFSKL